MVETKKLGAYRSVLLTKCYSGDQIEKNEVGGACSTYGEKRGVYGVLVGKPEGKRPLGRPRHRWKNNIETVLSEVWWVGIDWIDLAQDRDRLRYLVNAAMKLRVPKRVGGYLLTSEGTVSFPKRALLHVVGEVVCAVSFSRRPGLLS